MSMDSPAAFIDAVNSTRELPLSTVFAAALATGSSESVSLPQAVRPTASARSWRERRIFLTCKQSKQTSRRNGQPRKGDNARTVRKRRQTPLAEAIELGQTLASRHPWVDVDDLEYDDDFTRLVELLGDAEQIDDDGLRRGSAAGLEVPPRGGDGRDCRGARAAAGLDRGHGDPVRARRVGRAPAPASRPRRRRRESPPGRARVGGGGLERQPARAGDLDLAGSPGEERRDL